MVAHKTTLERHSENRTHKAMCVAAGGFNKLSNAITNFIDQDSALKIACLKKVMFYTILPSNAIRFSDVVSSSAKNIFNDSKLAKALNCRRTKTTFILNEV